jgi:hypothetical protein
MIRSVKMLGLAVVAVLAMSAVVASAAMAENFHSESSPTVLSGSQTATHEFTTSVGTVTCTTATFAGEATGTSVSEVSVHPTYEGCKLSGINISVTITTTGCNYRFYNVASKSGPTDIVCETGKSITVAGPGCTVTVGGQTGLNSVSYANEGAETSRTVKVTASVTGIAYSTKGFLCGTSSKTNGTYSGPTSVKGLTGGGVQQGIFVE